MFMYILLCQIVIEEDDKFLKLLELLGIYQEQGKHFTFNWKYIVKLVKDIVTEMVLFRELTAVEHFYPALPSLLKTVKVTFLLN